MSKRDSQYATKQDLKHDLNELSLDLRKEIRNSVDETATTIADALQLILERFDRQDRKFEHMFKQTHAILRRIENKLDATAEHVDDHEVRIKRLERQPV